MKKMDDQDELEALRQAGWTGREIRRLRRFRQMHKITLMDQSPVDLARLRFVRWLVVHGKLTDDIPLEEKKIGGQETGLFGTMQTAEPFRSGR